MRIPLWISIFLPKSTQDKSMRGRWDDKSDEQIIYAYKDNWDWNRLWTTMAEPRSEVTLNAIAQGKERYETLIRPQLEARGITVDPPTSKYGYMMGDEL